MSVMLHRHLNHQRYTLAAIDAVIVRGRWQDWAELRQAILADRPPGGGPDSVKSIIVSPLPW